MTRDEQLTGSVVTVLGSVDVADLGRTDYHEHLFQTTPLMPGEELDDEDASGQEAVLLHQSGFDAMIDATPTGLGRDPSAVARISSVSGLHVVATTGAHREAHYAPGHWLLDLTERQLADRFARDLQLGMATADTADQGEPATTETGAPIRAGVLKAGIGYWTWTTFERRVLAAVADAHDRTGAPVMVHLEHGSATVELLELLAGDGVRSEAVLLAHVDRNPDPVLHAELAAGGAYLGYDGFARSRTWPDSVLLDCLVQAAELGASERLLVGGDVARRTRYVAYGGRPGLAYVGRRVIPRLERVGGAELVAAVTVANPGRYLSTASRAAQHRPLPAGDARPRPAPNTCPSTPTPRPRTPSTRTPGTRPNTQGSTSTQ